MVGLRGRAYRRAGRWSLGQNCEHIAKMLEQSIDGFDEKMPWLLRAMSGVVKWMTMRTRWMPSGVKAPASFLPGDSVDDAAGVDRLVAAIDRYVNHAGPMQPSPLFGELSRGDWDQLQLIHASHHLGFIVPDDATAAASRAGV